MAMMSDDDDEDDDDDNDNDDDGVDDDVDDDDEKNREKVKFNLKKLVRLLHVAKPVDLIMGLIGKKWVDM